MLYKKIFFFIDSPESGKDKAVFGIVSILKIEKVNAGTPVFF
jgi:hypothetical protein